MTKTFLVNASRGGSSSQIELKKLPQSKTKKLGINLQLVQKVESTLSKRELYAVSGASQHTRKELSAQQILDLRPQLVYLPSDEILHQLIWKASEKIEVSVRPKP